MLRVMPYIVLCSVLVACAGGEKKIQNDSASVGQGDKITSSEENLHLSSVWKKPSYFFLMDKFHDGNKSNNLNVKNENVLAYQGGDLSGVSKKADYFAKLNVGSLLTTPLTMNRLTDQNGHWGAHGYWIVDHLKLDPHWGTDEEMKNFVELREKKNQKYILDLVLNHVDATHPWVSAHPDWFHKLGDITNFEDERQVKEGQLHGLPDLDQNNPEVYKALLEYAKHWIDFTKADGLRLDAVKHIDQSFWKRFLGDIKQYVGEKKEAKDFLLLGEIFHGDPQAYLPYLDSGFNAFFDYPLYYSMADVFGKNQSMLKLPARLQTMDKLFGNKVLWATFIDNHDTPRFMSLARKTNFEDLKQAWAFCLTVRGMPVLYSGTEERMTGDKGESGRKKLRFNRQQDFDELARLNKLRADLPSLSEGIREDLKATNTLYVFRRITPHEETLVIFNRADAPGTLGLQLEEDSLFANQKKIAEFQNPQRVFNIKDKKITIFLRKKDFVVLSLKGDAKRFETLAHKKLQTKMLKVFIDTDLKEGEGIYLVGANKELGSWDPMKAVGPFDQVMENKYGSEVEVPEGAVLEYKFVKRNAQGEVTWENGDNHYLFIDSATTQIRRTWGNY